MFTDAMESMENDVWLSSVLGSPSALASLALVISLASLLISYAALRRDRHDIRAFSTATPVLMHQRWDLIVNVANHGKRPVSMRGVTVVRVNEDKSEHSYNYTFKPDELARLDVGQGLSRTIKMGDLGLMWSSSDDLKRLKIYVEDALGQRYRALYRGYQFNVD